MARKVLGNAVTDANERNGDSLHFGTADIDQINNYLSGQDQSTGDPTLAVPIATLTSYNNQKLRLQDSLAAGQYYIINTSPITGNINVIYPLLTADDTHVFAAATQTLTNKTLTNPSISGSGGALTLPAGPDTLLGRNTTDTLTNKTLTSPKFSSIVNTGTLTLPTSTDTLTGRATIDTLTNKTIDVESNTIKDLSGFTYIVYRNAGGTYKARNTLTGNIDFSGATPDSVIQSVLTNQGNVYIANPNPTQGSFGIITLSAGFTGFTIPSYTNVSLDHFTILRAPSGFTGSVFTMTNTQQSVFHGGRIDISGGAPNSATCFTMTGSGAGVDFCRISDVIIVNFNVGVNLNQANTTGWVNGNYFENITPSGCIIGIDFNIQPTNPGINSNLFHQCVGQSNTASTTVQTTNGIRNIAGFRNVFVNCGMWDLNLPTNINASASNVSANAQDTVIIGGIMDSTGFTDSGVRTRINTAYHTTVGAAPAGLNVCTAVTDKLGFYGKTPMVQQANTAGSVTSTGGPTYGSTEQKMLNDCYTVLRNIGLLS